MTKRQVNNWWHVLKMSSFQPFVFLWIINLPTVSSRSTVSSEWRVDRGHFCYFWLIAILWRHIVSSSITGSLPLTLWTHTFADWNNFWKLLKLTVQLTHTFCLVRAFLTKQKGRYQRRVSANRFVKFFAGEKWIYFGEDIMPLIHSGNVWPVNWYQADLSLTSAVKKKSIHNEPQSLRSDLAF